MTPHRFLARCLRGLEWITAAEIEHSIAGVVDGIRHREVRFHTRGPSSAQMLARLRTADDVFLVATEADGVDRARASLQRLADVASARQWRDVTAALRQLRPDAAWKRFSVTASFLGKRNYNRYEIEDAVAEGIAADTGLPYRRSRDTPSPESELSIRVHIVDDRALFAARVFDSPLHRRSYKIHAHLGSLHPPLAAAMAILAGVGPADVVLDPFAGAGTIGIETQRLEPSAIVIAGDIDPARVAEARHNAGREGVSARFAVLDGGALPFAACSMTRVITNPPWDIVVGARGEYGKAPASRRHLELSRVLAPDGRAVMLISDVTDALLEPFEAAGFRAALRFQVSVFGQHPWLVNLTPHAAPSGIDRALPFGEALARNVTALQD